MPTRRNLIFSVLLILIVASFISWHNSWLDEPHQRIKAYLFSDTPDREPVAHLKNGTYVGARDPNYNHDVFVGIPYAQPPIGDHRLRRARPLNDSWEGTRDAKEIRMQCMGHGNSWGTNRDMPKSEDCLFLNIVRPSRSVSDTSLLPVGVWIHGGKFATGGIFEERYYMGHMVKEGTDVGKPFIAVQISYRLAGFGFMFSSELLKEGNTNLGLRDQRLAFQWIQENIRGFGGDPRRVTIWGESAGAASVGQHLIAYGGRDDGLFRAAIMQSGNPVGLEGYHDETYYNEKFNAVARGAGCNKKSDVLDCLRALPYKRFLSVLDAHDPILWLPTIDNDLIQDYPSKQLAAGKFVHVPIISGANTDEGVLFTPTSINSNADFVHMLSEGKPFKPPDVNVNASTAQHILALYPNEECHGAPAHLACTAPSPKQGAMHRRVALYIGDVVFVANRRLTCRTWADAGQPAYCYRFNAVPMGWETGLGATHFAEVAFVLNNTLGAGYANHKAGGPLGSRPDSFHRLARLMSRAWASFIVDTNPNTWRRNRWAVEAWAGELVSWPKYKVSAGGDDGQGSEGFGNEEYSVDGSESGGPLIFVFDADFKDERVASKVEADTFRSEAIEALIELNEAFER